MFFAKVALFFTFSICAAQAVRSYTTDDCPVQDVHRQSDQKNHNLSNGSDDFQNHESILLEMVQKNQTLRHAPSGRELTLMESPTQTAGVASSIEEAKVIDGDPEKLSSPSKESPRQEEHTVKCEQEKGVRDEDPVHLVVYGFDETLALTKKGTTFRQWDNWAGRPNKSVDDAIIARMFIEGNRSEGNRSELPTIEENRLEMLQQSLANLKAAGKVLAVLTDNKGGGWAVLNLLHAANLAEFFDVIWCVDLKFIYAKSVYKDIKNSRWQHFYAPIDDLKVEFDLGNGDRAYVVQKTDVLYDLVERADRWFPQLNDPSRTDLQKLKELTPTSFVLIDDKPGNFISYKDWGKNDEENQRLLRHCLVPAINPEPDERFPAPSKQNFGERFSAPSKQKEFSFGGVGAWNAGDFQQIWEFVSK